MLLCIKKRVEFALLSEVLCFQYIQKYLWYKRQLCQISVILLISGVVARETYSFAKCIHLLSSNRFQGTCYSSCFIFGSIRNENVLLMQVCSLLCSTQCKMLLFFSFVRLQYQIVLLLHVFGFGSNFIFFMFSNTNLASQFCESDGLTTAFGFYCRLCHKSFN